MRITVFACAMLALSVAALPLASSQQNHDDEAQTGGNPCVRTYLAGTADGTYVFTTAPTSTSALGAGLATNVVGSGVAFFVIVQPTNCTGTGVGDPDDDADSTSASPQKECPHFVLP